MTQTVKINFNLSQEDFECIVDTAGYMIGYWASEGFMTGDIYNLIDDEAQTYEITKDQVELAIAGIVNGDHKVSKSIQEDVINAVAQSECGELDGNAADALIQLCCFDQIVYA